MIEITEDRKAKFQEVYDRGLELLEKGQTDEGNRCMLEAVKIAPEAWLALATEFIKDENYDAATARLREMLAVTKNSVLRAAGLNNLGMVFANTGHNDLAEKSFREAYAEAPQFADTLSNIGLMEAWKNNFKSSVRYCDEALKRDHWHEVASFVKSMSLLLDCDYLRGFEQYECRWRSRNNKLKKIVTAFPEWDGTNGKRVFVYGEQGHGDSFLMLRYAKVLRERGLWQSWVCQKPITSLLRTIPEIDHVCEVGSELPDYDCHIPAVSLPRVLKTTIDSIPPAPYIPRPEPHDYGPGFHVGVCWRGSAAQGNDKFRSTDLMYWFPVLSVPGVTFHSLQVDNADEALLYTAVHQEDKPADFLETARRVCGLNLVITVDTSIVHLCGALGVPCWVAMHCRPYFVYPPCYGEKTPWYESVKLFRQVKELEWKLTFERIANELRRIIG